MLEEHRTHITESLQKLAEGRVPPAEVVEEITPLVYDEMRRLANSFLKRERANHTLDPTGLVHEAYMRLVDQEKVGWQGRNHFLALGAKMMRRILIDYARRRGSAKRGGGVLNVALDEGQLPLLGLSLDRDQLVGLSIALEKLAELDPRQAKVVELRFFAGLEVGEVAEMLEVSRRTVEGDWTHARAWLRRELSAVAGS